MALLLVVLAAVAASPAAAQYAAPAGQSEAWGTGRGERTGTPWSAERAFVEIERLQGEIGTLRALAAAQAALLEWNRAKAESGSGAAVLPEALCAEEDLAPWCRALPATFGAGGDGRGITPVKGITPVGGNVPVHGEDGEQ